MAKEKKLTQVKIRNENGNVTETIPVSVSVNNIKYDDNTSLKNKIDSLQLDTKLDKNLGAGKEGYFLALDEAGNIVPENLNTDKIKQSLHIPTDLSQFNNATKFVTEEDLKNKYSLEYTQNQTSDIVTNNTIDNLSNSIGSLQQNFIDFANASAQTQTSNEESIRNLNKKILHFESFMQDVNGFYNLRIDESADGHNLIPTALQIIENTDKISALEDKLATEDELIKDIGASFSTFEQLYQFKDIENKVDKIQYAPGISYVHFGSVSNTNHMDFWGNTTNRVAISATSAEDNRTIAILGRLDDYKGINLAEFDAEGNGKILYNTERFIGGQTFTLAAGTYLTGYITGSGSRVYCFASMPKSCKGRKINIDWGNKRFSVRTVSGYLNKTSDLYWKNFKKDVTVRGDNGIGIMFEDPKNAPYAKPPVYVQFSNPPQPTYNNTVVTLQILDDLTITFS